MSDFAEAYGLAFQIYDSDTDDYRQLTLIERARSDGATGLIVCPLSDALLSEALTSVQQAAIPLVLMSDPENKYGGVALAARDSDWRMGLKTGRWAGQTIRDTMDGQAEVIILDFPDMATIVERANGLESGLLEYAPEANIIGRYLGGTRENAYDSVSRLLDDGVRFDVIASINDAGSFGAVQALEEAEIGPDEVMIASIDAEFQAQQYIRDDYYIRATLSLDRQGTARDTVNVMVRLLGGGEVPEIILQPLGDMVTKETLQQPTPVPGG
jgi:ABC-type sugar transport system substrate-binding protein